MYQMLVTKQVGQFILKNDVDLNNVIGYLINSARIRNYQITCLKYSKDHWQMLFFLLCVYSCDHACFTLNKNSPKSYLCYSNTLW